MSKLVITSAVDGTIRFVEGEEVEISLDQIKAKVSEMGQRKIEITKSLSTKLAELKNEENDKFNKVKEEFDQEVKLAQDKYNSLVENLKNEYSLKMDLQLKEDEETREELVSLEKELAKLTTILRSIEPEIAQPAKEAEVEPVISEPVAQPNLSNRLIF